MRRINTWSPAELNIAGDAARGTQEIERIQTKVSF